MHDINVANIPPATHIQTFVIIPNTLIGRLFLTASQNKTPWAPCKIAKVDNGSRRISRNGYFPHQEVPYTSETGSFNEDLGPTQTKSDKIQSLSRPYNHI